jgi:hypothetical protein
MDKIALDASVFAGAAFGTTIEYDAAAGALFYNDLQFAVLGMGAEHPSVLDAGDFQIA